MPETKKHCGGSETADFLPASFLDRSAVRKGRPRVSRMGKRRAWVLILIHLAVFAHLLHWQLRGKTLSPMEPSETMYSLRDGILNAGAILMALSTLSVLVLGRFFCGWACHLVALQDLAAWLLKKMGMRPRPLRSRFLVFVPFGAALVMFGMPVLYRYRKDLGFPEVQNGLLKSEFWETFPGFWVGLMTFLFCGFVMVWLLGSKGFCTFACPYGGVFGVVEKLAPGRIRVDDSCKACGHCTAVCTSNVAVAEEVHRFGMVVDSGCMKCMDCISVCPENALHFGFGKPALFAAGKKTARKKSWDFKLGTEIAMAAVFALSLVTFAGLPNTFVSWADSLNGQTPLLFALGLSAVTAFLFGICWKSLRRGAQTITGLKISSTKGLSFGGKIFVFCAFGWFVFCGFCGVVQYNYFQAQAIFQTVNIQAYAWLPKNAERPKELLDDVARAQAYFERARKLSLFPDLRLPSRLAALAMVQGEPELAIEEFQNAKKIAPEHLETRLELASVYAHVGRVKDAIEEGRGAAALNHEDRSIRFAVMRWAIMIEDWQSALTMAEDLLSLIPAADRDMMQLNMVGFEFNLGRIEAAHQRALSLVEALPANSRLRAYLQQIEMQRQR